jgi:hypothetical protein
MTVLRRAEVRRNLYARFGKRAGRNGLETEGNPVTMP